MGLSKLEIYNNALQLVSRSRITSVDDGSAEAKLCNDLFPRTFDNTLYEHAWNSVTKRVKLVELSEIPVQGYTKTFQLPNDMIRLIQAYNTDAFTDGFDFSWEIEDGKKLVCNEGEVWIKYVYRPVNFEQMNPALLECVVYKLAMALSFPMTGDSGRETQLLQQYEMKVLPRAKSIDSMESRYVEFEESSWIQSMYNEHPQIW